MVLFISSELPLKKSTFSAVQLFVCKTKSTDFPVTMGACGQLQAVWDGEK